jgi:DnaJ-class molecular chaperone
MSKWTSPRYADQIAVYERQSGAPFQPLTMGTCTNCGGAGRHIYVDSDGQMKDLPCQSCGGSGQTQ